MDDNYWQVCSTEDTNSGQGQTDNGCAVKGAQQQYHHQRQVMLPSFQLPFGQNIKRRVSQIIEASRASPACPSTESPACPSTESPACPSTESPACPSTESPACPSTESPACPSTESPACPSTESPACPSTESPACPSTESPACPSTESPACPSTESPACPSTESPACSSTESPACSSTESPACSSTESPACSSTESPACWSTESPACWPTEAPIGDEDTNSGQGQTDNGCAVKGAQQQYHHQRQVTLPSFQLSFGQNIKRQVSQIIDASRASPAGWPTESSACFSTESTACFSTESTACFSTEYPACFSTESPACFSTESPACFSTESPVCFSTESPACFSTESPACFSTESPACFSTESPACLSTESPACLSTESPIGGQAIAGLGHENFFQLEELPFSGVQGVQLQVDHTPQIISNAPILQSHGTYPNLIAECAVSSTPDYQHIEGVSPKQTANAGTEIISHQLQKLPDDPNKGHNVVTVTNPATMSAPNKHSQVNDNVTPNLVIAATATTTKLTKSQTSNSELNTPRRRRRYSGPSCINPDKRNSESRKKHICHFPGCTRVFEYPCVLQDHIRSHTGEKPFVCTWESCGKRFGRFAYLQRHLRIHTDEKRFQCTECLKRFSRSDSRLHHFERYHNKRTFQEPT